jgi:methoxymalonate biosynthesis acyl carrier protein
MVRAGSLQQRIQAIFNDRLQVEVPAAGIDLFETGLIDSLVFIDLLLALEEEFSMEIALDHVNLDDFRSVARIADFISLQNNPIEEIPVGWHSAS